MAISVRIEDGFDLTEVIDHLKSKGNFGSFQLTGDLEGVLRKAFLDTQAKTHIITGSLKSSGKTSSDFDGKVWRGTISYGGQSTGPHNPVDYAIYEMARGGDHDFFRDLHLYEQEYVDAIDRHMLG